MADQVTAETVEQPVTPEQTAQAPSPDTQRSAPPEQPQSPRLQKLAELGFEGVKDEGEAFDRLLAAHLNLKNEFGSQLQQTLAELKQTVQPTTDTPAQDARTASANSAKWNWAPPAVDPTVLAQYRTADGWKDGTPDSVKQAAAARQAYLDSFAQKFVSDPAATLDPLLEDRFEQLFEKKYGQLNAQQQAQSFQQKLIADNPWLFESDPISGKPKVGDFNALSTEGKLIDQYMREAQQRGADYELAWEFALSKHTAAKAAIAAKNAAQAQTAEQANEALKKQLLQRGGGFNRTQTLPTPAESRVTPRQQNLSPGQKALLTHQRNGHAV